MVGRGGDAACRDSLVIVGREIIDDLPDPGPMEGKKYWQKMARMTRVARTTRVARRFSRPVITVQHLPHRFYSA